MPVIVGRAPGKIILFGEHAVVYGQPAIAIPVKSVKASAHIAPIFDAEHAMVHISAPDINLNTALSNLTEDHPIAKAISLTLKQCQVKQPPSFSLQVTSTIPISGGMGSGAAISVAIIRAVSGFLGKPLPEKALADLAFEVEKIHHGTPSGIDNTVVAYQKPIFFVKEKPPEFLQISHPTHWIIADTGERTPTLATVAAVRNLHNEDPGFYGEIFEKIGKLSLNARNALEKGDIPVLGNLMIENQEFLSELNVSSPKLDLLINAARSAGAEGAKLSGGGRGGNIIALSKPDHMTRIEDALRKAGAIRVIRTLLSGHGEV